MLCRECFATSTSGTIDRGAGGAGGDDGDTWRQELVAVTPLREMAELDAQRERERAYRARRLSVAGLAEAAERRRAAGREAERRSAPDVYGECSLVSLP